MALNRGARAAPRQWGWTHPPPIPDPTPPPAAGTLRWRAAPSRAGIPRGASARSRPPSLSMRREHSSMRPFLCCRGAEAARAPRRAARRKGPRANPDGTVVAAQSTWRAVARGTRLASPAESTGTLPEAPSFRRWRRCFLRRGAAMAAPQSTGASPGIAALRAASAPAIPTRRRRSCTRTTTRATSRRKGLLPIRPTRIGFLFLLVMELQKGLRARLSYFRTPTRRTNRMPTPWRRAGRSRGSPIDAPFTPPVLPAAPCLAEQPTRQTHTRHAPRRGPMRHRASRAGGRRPQPPPPRAAAAWPRAPAPCWIVRCGSALRLRRRQVRRRPIPSVSCRPGRRLGRGLARFGMACR